MSIFNGKINYKWPFSIAMLNYQRVYGMNESHPPRNKAFLTWPQTRTDDPNGSPSPDSSRPLRAGPISAGGTWQGAGLAWMRSSLRWLWITRLEMEDEWSWATGKYLNCSVPGVLEVPLPVISTADGTIHSTQLRQVLRVQSSRGPSAGETPKTRRSARPTAPNGRWNDPFLWFLNGF